MKTILLVEDNPHIMKINKAALGMEGYGVLTASDAAQCRQVLGQTQVDLIILDIMLPDGDGISLCREIRTVYDTPILFLSALNENADIVAALRAGGDGYLAKPYDISVLLAHVEARLRTAERSQPCIVSGKLRLDPVSMLALVGEQDLLLTQKEFQILLRLVRSRNVPVEKEELYQSVWGCPMLDNSSALYTAISRLNKKLSRACSGLVITSEHAIGYILEEI